MEEGLFLGESSGDSCKEGAVVKKDSAGGGHEAFEGGLDHGFVAGVEILGGVAVAAGGGDVEHAEAVGGFFAHQVADAAVGFAEVVVAACGVVVGVVEFDGGFAGEGDQDVILSALDAAAAVDEAVEGPAFASEGGKADASGVQRLGDHEVAGFVEGGAAEVFLGGLGEIFRGGVFHAKHGFDQVVHVDLLFPPVGGLEGGFVQDRLQFRAGAVADHFREIVHVDGIRDFLAGQIMLDDGAGVLVGGGFDLDLFVKSSDTDERVRELVHLVGGGDDKYVQVFDVVDSGLYGHVLGRVLMFGVFVGEFVHIVQKDDAGRFFFGFPEGLGDLPDEVVVALVSSEREGLQSALLDEAARHQRFAQAGVAVQEDPLRGFRAERFIHFSVPDQITDLQEFRLNGFIADHFVKCTHFSLSLSSCFCPSICLSLRSQMITCRPAAAKPSTPLRKMGPRS